MTLLLLSDGPFGQPTSVIERTVLICDSSSGMVSLFFYICETVESAYLRHTYSSLTGLLFLILHLGD